MDLCECSLQLCLDINTVLTIPQFVLVCIPKDVLSGCVLSSAVFFSLNWLIKFTSIGPNFYSVSVDSI